jgi:hypothetical protein
VTGDLSFLPIHAAEITRGSSVERTSDYVVSSYTPTLAALSKARKEWSSIARDQVTGIVAGCKDAPKMTRLHNVQEEMDVTVKCFQDGSARVLNAPQPNTSLERVLAE